MREEGTWRWEERRWNTWRAALLVAATGSRPGRASGRSPGEKQVAERRSRPPHSPCQAARRRCHLEEPLEGQVDFLHRHSLLPHQDPGGLIH